MDATCRPHQFSPELFAYAESKRIFEIFQNMMERLTIERPENPIDFLYGLLLKGAVYDVPKVYVIGPPTVDRKLVCTTLASKLNLVYISCTSLKEDLQLDLSSKETISELSPSAWADLVQKRVEMPDCVQNGWILEAFPKTRSQAFALRKNGIFPTHIVTIEDPVFASRVTLQCCPQVSEVLKSEELQEMLDFLGQKELILDLHKSTYSKSFQIGTNVNDSLEKVIEFVRSKQRPRLPYLPRVLLLGPYGSGRKTMASKLAEKYHVVKVDYQEELRRAALRDSPLKQKFQEILKTPEPVPDELLASVASQRLLRSDCIERGWVMFNFPDTLKQAELLIQYLEGFQVNRAIFLDASLDKCLARVEPRRLDPQTGHLYHLKLRPCQQRLAVSRLIQLPQDCAESVEADYRLYEENVDELKMFFKSKLLDDIAVEVNANCNVEEVFEEVQAAILKSTKLKLLTT
ncbi:adenylate kinase 8-like [Stegodyphus dumicola]|uniref:adenylate kinase 8-like n=1 Tax=Stegodyphus dumicola TaxID=202533 RepID=UPI0015AD6B22|nr:adenylate kinase 8-like [Stegodyphus dumicola]